MPTNLERSNSRVHDAKPCPFIHNVPRGQNFGNKTVF